MRLPGIGGKQIPIPTEQFRLYWTTAGTDWDLDIVKRYPDIVIDEIQVDRVGRWCVPGAILVASGLNHGTLFNDCDLPLASTYNHYIQHNPKQSYTHPKNNTSNTTC